MQRKKVSVIVIAFNVEPYIEKCLNSLVEQTLDDLEILIVVTASEDRTDVIARTFAEVYPDRIKIISSPVRGLGPARNLGIANACGEFVGFVDSDDWVERDMFERLYTQATVSGSDLVVCNYQTYMHNILTLGALSRLRFVISSASRRGLVYHGFRDLGYGDTRSNLIMSGTTAVWNKLFRRDLIAGKRFFDDIVPEDYDFTISCIAESQRPTVVDAVLYHYRVREDSTLGDMRYFKRDPYQLFTSISRSRERIVTTHPNLLKAFDDRAVLGLFNWNIDYIHRIKAAGERREYAKRWAQLLNQTLPKWEERQPISDWSGGIASLERLVKCYRNESIDDQYDQLVDQITSPPYALAISFWRSRRMLLKL